MYRTTTIASSQFPSNKGKESSISIFNLKYCLNYYYYYYLVRVKKIICVCMLIPQDFFSFFDYQQITSQKGINIVPIFFLKKGNSLHTCIDFQVYNS